MKYDNSGIWIELDTQALDEFFADTIAKVTARLIECTTATVREFVENAE